MIEDYAPRFIQLYDEDDIIIDVNNFNDGKIFTIEEIELYGWSINPCTWSKATTWLDKNSGKERHRQAFFSTGAAEGTGSIKALHKNRLPSSLQKDVKTFFGSVEAGIDISFAADSLVGGIDALRGLTEELYYELQSIMLDYWKTCKGGNRNLTEEEELDLHNILHKNVLKHTQMQRSLL